LPVFWVRVLDSLVEAGHDKAVALEALYQKEARDVVLVFNGQLAKAFFDLLKF